MGALLEPPPHPPLHPPIRLGGQGPQRSFGDRVAPRALRVQKEDPLLDVWRSMRLWSGWSVVSRKKNFRECVLSTSVHTMVMGPKDWGVSAPALRKAPSLYSAWASTLRLSITLNEKRKPRSCPCRILRGTWLPVHECLTTVRLPVAPFESSTVPNPPGSAAYRHEVHLAGKENCQLTVEQHLG